MSELSPAIAAQLQEVEITNRKQSQLERAIQLQIEGTPTKNEVLDAFLPLLSSASSRWFVDAILEDFGLIVTVEQIHALRKSLKTQWETP